MDILLCPFYIHIGRSRLKLKLVYREIHVKCLRIIALVVAITAIGGATSAIEATAAESRTLNIYTTTPQVPAGGWAKVAGFLKTSGGDPVAGQTVYLQYENNGSWAGLRQATTAADGYYQFWFQPWGDPVLRAQAPGPPKATSSSVTVQTYRLSAWRSKSTTTFWGWVKVHGLYKNGVGSPLVGHQLFLQVWDHATSDWKWAGTTRTGSNGYYSVWARPWATSKYRVATAGSARVSNPATVSVKLKPGLNALSSVTNLGNTLRFNGWLSPTHLGHTVYFQKYNSITKTWEWLSSHRIVSSSAFSTQYQFLTTGWHAFRLSAPAHWDHVANVSGTVWVKVVR